MTDCVQRNNFRAKCAIIFAVAAIACFALGLAYAAVLNFSWQNATENTDGSPIPLTGDARIVSTTVEYGPCNAARDALESVTNTAIATGTNTSAQSIDLPPGTWCARAAHVNGYGNVSAWSPIAVRVIETPKPKPPSNFTFG